MTDFDTWFRRQGAKCEVQSALPEGVWERDGKYFAACRSCGNEYELPIDPIDDGFDPDMSYCGRSQWCLP